MHTYGLCPFSEGCVGYASDPKALRTSADTIFVEPANSTTHLWFFLDSKHTRHSSSDMLDLHESMMQVYAATAVGQNAACEKCRPTLFFARSLMRHNIIVSLAQFVSRERGSASTRGLRNVQLAEVQFDCSRSRTMKRKQADTPPSSSDSDSSDDETDSTGEEDATSSSEASSSDAYDSDGASAEEHTSPQAQQQQPQTEAAVPKHSAAAQRAAPARSAPMLPWMRVPIAIEGGASVPLADVRGLHPQLAAAMQSGESHVMRVHIIQASEGP